MELHSVGVSGILAVLGDAISEETGARVAALSAAVRDAHLSGVTEMIPAYASLLIKYDPFLTDYAALADRLRELERHISSSAAQEGRIVDIPVCYGGKYGEDLPFVARHAGLSAERSTNAGALTSSFVTLAGMAGDIAPTASDVAALVNAAIMYEATGKPCGEQPLAAWRDFMRHLTKCLQAAVTGDSAALIDNANAATVAALEVTKMPAAFLGGNKDGVKK